jgi:hypothetical protein
MDVISKPSMYCNGAWSRLHVRVIADDLRDWKSMNMVIFMDYSNPKVRYYQLRMRELTPTGIQRRLS